MAFVIENDKKAWYDYVLQDFIIIFSHRKFSSVFKYF